MPLTGRHLLSAGTVAALAAPALAGCGAGGAATPDLRMGDIAWPAQFAYNAPAPPAFWRRYPEAVIRSLSFEGEAYAFYADQAYLYYRADLLQRHGLAVPRTWEELADAAERVVGAGDAEVGLAMQGAVYEGLTSI